MNSVNVAEYLLYLTENNFTSADDVTSSNEIFAAQRLFQILKSYRSSSFNELYGYETLDFNDEFDALSDEEENNSEEDDYVKNQWEGISKFYGGRDGKYC